MDIREVARKLYRQLLSYRKVSQLLFTSHSTIYRWVHNLVGNGTKSNRKKILDKPWVLLYLETVIQSNPFVTSRELMNLLQTKNIFVSEELVRLCVRKGLKMTLKKPHFYPKTNWKSQEINVFKKALSEAIKKKKLVAIDETGFSTNVRPLAGLSRRGERLQVIFKPLLKDRKHTSVEAAIDQKGRLFYKSKEGHYNTYSFLEFLKESSFKKGSVLLMDNVRFHHSKSVKEYCKGRGWKLLYCPPYSPWFNPIEQVFSIVKRHYRIHRDIDHAFETVTQYAVQNIINTLLKNLKEA